MSNKKDSWEKEIEGLLYEILPEGYYAGKLSSIEKVKQFIKKVETDAVRGVLEEMEKEVLWLLRSDLERTKALEYIVDIVSKLKSNLKEEAK